MLSFCSPVVLSIFTSVVGLISKKKGAIIKWSANTPLKSTKEIKQMAARRLAGGVLVGSLGFAALNQWFLFNGINWLMWTAQEHIFY